MKETIQKQWNSRPKGGSNKLIDIAAEEKGNTEKAFRLFDGSKTEWVPKSQVEKNEDGTYTMPEWLAYEKGFL